MIFYLLIGLLSLLLRLGVIMTSGGVAELSLVDAFLLGEGVIEGGIGVIGIWVRETLPSSNTLLWCGLMFWDMI